jgi:tetratricopeptide (TPR) repeat protein
LLIAGDNGRLQTVNTALFNFLHFSGRWDDLLSLNTEGEARAERSSDFKNAGWRAHDAGVCHHLRGQTAAVLACADRASAYWQAARAGATMRAIAIRLRGLGHKLARDYPAAVTAFREALDLWRSLSPKSRDTALGLNSLAEALRESGQIDEAEPHYHEALVIACAKSFRVHERPDRLTGCETWRNRCRAISSAVAFRG